jgi:hypothetical protein
MYTHMCIHKIFTHLHIGFNFQGFRIYSQMKQYIHIYIHICIQMFIHVQNINIAGLYIYVSIYRDYIYISIV